MESSKPRTISRSFMSFADDIKIAHTVFALPFAASALLISEAKLPSLSNLVLLLVCMVTARTFAMGSNRWLDSDIDAKNPRTRNRSIPSGRLSSREGLVFTICSGLIFVLASAALSERALIFSIPLLAILAGYSLMKRISWLSHFYLGACLGLAPIAVCIALDAQVTIEILLLALSVTVWTAGFDCLYALQDIDFDMRTGLHSIPQRFGPKITLGMSAFCFFLMTLLLILVGVLGERNFIFYCGITAIASLLAFELWLVRDARHTGSSKNINAAFFTSNAFVSVIFFIFCLMEKLL